MRIRNAITESAANGYTIAAIAREHGLSEARVLDLLDAAAWGYNTPEDREASIGSGSVSRSKPSEGQSKVIPHVPPKDRLGAHTVASPSKPAHSSPSSSGVLRICTVCGEIIQASGKRGRPRIKHQECR